MIQSHLNRQSKMSLNKRWLMAEKNSDWPGGQHTPGSINWEVLSLRPHQARHAVPSILGPSDARCPQ